jgi:membrane associated rhomboid family serine protease
MSGLIDDFRNEFNKPNNALVQIILVNVVIYLLLLILKWGLQLSGHGAVYDDFIGQLTMSAHLPSFARHPWTLVSYFFTHVDIFHVLWNMLFLYWFGRLVDEYLGSRRLVGLYILGGLAGGLTYLAIYNLAPYFQGQVLESQLLGASGAAFSVAVGAATLLPNYTFQMLFLGPVRIKYIVLFFIVLSFAQSTGSNAGGELAHLGGALIGFVYVRLLQNGSDIGQPIYWLMDGWQQLVHPRPTVKVSQRQRSNAPAHTNTYVSTTTHTAPGSTPDQDEIDALLDKISRSGYESLTRDEKQKLFRASQKG